MLARPAISFPEASSGPVRGHAQSCARNHHFRRGDACVAPTWGSACVAPMRGSVCRRIVRRSACVAPTGGNARPRAEVGFGRRHRGIIQIGDNETGQQDPRYSTSALLAEGTLRARHPRRGRPLEDPDVRCPEPALVGTGRGLSGSSARSLRGDACVAPTPGSASVASTRRESASRRDALRRARVGRRAGRS
jgi:hypothetical protein